jgi:hypothetical protein
VDSRRRRAAHVVSAAVAVAVAVELSITDFVELHRLPDHAIRDRFDLPASCQPAITAMRGVRTKVIVLVTCVEGDGGIRDDDEKGGP